MLPGGGQGSRVVVEMDEMGKEIVMQGSFENSFDSRISNNSVAD